MSNLIKSGLFHNNKEYRNGIYEKFYLFHNFNWHLFSIFIISSFSLFYGITDDLTQSLSAHDEGLYAGRAKLILTEDNWFTPFKNPHHKTVGSYWLIAFFFKYLGISDFTARFPSLIFSIACSFLLYFIGRYFLSRTSALFSTVILSSLPLWQQYSRYSSPDMIYIFLFLLIIYITFNIKYTSNDNLILTYILFFLLGFVFGISIFVRSLMIVAPFLALAPFIYFSIDNNHLKAFLFMLLGILLGLIPTFYNIFISINIYGPTALRTLLGFAGSQALGGKAFSGLLFYPLNILLLSYPGSIFCFFAFPHLFKNKKKEIQKLLFIFPLIYLLILLSLTASYSHYSLPLLPIISLLSGYTFEIFIKGSYTLTSIRQLSILFAFSFFILVTFILFKVYNLLPDIQLNSYLFIPFILLLALSSFIYSINIYRKHLSTKGFVISSFLIITIQIILSTILYSLGIIGNPNNELKAFINKSSHSYIFNTNTIYLTELNGKYKTLFQYYLPNYKYIDSNKIDSYKDKYILAQKRFINNLKLNYDYSLIATYKEFNLIRIID